MRFLGVAIVSGAVILSACGGGGEKQAADTTAAAPTTATPAPASNVAAAPITGTIHEVKMIGDASGYHYDPANITAKTGDGIKFVVVSGGPHNVSVDPATLPADSRDQFMANMPNMSNNGSPMLTDPNSTWTLSLGNIKPGVYQIYCTPHLAMGMKATITVTP